MPKFSGMPHSGLYIYPVSRSCIIFRHNTEGMGWGGEDIEFREFSGLWYLYVRRRLVPGSMASRAYDIIIGLRDPRSNAEACKGPGCCPPA